MPKIAKYVSDLFYDLISQTNITQRDPKLSGNEKGFYVLNQTICVVYTEILKIKKGSQLG